jgi:YidC/Oxa1 family membrane protein insertase
MDKRTILALALVAIVIIITPKLFPSAPRRLPPSVAVPDSSATAATAISGSDTSVPGTVDSGRTTHPAQVEAPSTAATAETTLVHTAAADYRFSNLGAALLDVTLAAFRALDRSDRQVTLQSDGHSLIGYRLISEADTIDLERSRFTVSRSEDQRGHLTLRYAGTGDAAGVEFVYDVVPDSFLIHVSSKLGVSSSETPHYLLIALPRTFRSFEADTTDDQKHFAYAVKPRTRNTEGITFGSLDPGERRVVPGPIAWAAAKSKYFIVGVLPPAESDEGVEVSATGGARLTKTATMASASLVMRVPPSGDVTFDLYTGPQKWQQLRALGREFENSNPYGGWLQGVVQPFATMVLRVLLWMRATFKLNYGWILIIFGVAVRTILWPLNQTAMRSSLKMQRLQPELNDIQKRFKSDPQKMQAEMMRVYKEHNMSPFSTFAGCLPMLLPMPVLFALFFVFQNTIEFRGVSFLWLSDISVHDPLYVVPLLMGVSMFGLSWIGMRNAPPNPQAKVMLYVFPVMMTVLFANFASGLNLYYAVQNIAAIPQQWLIANERAKSAPVVRKG